MTEILFVHSNFPGQFVHVARAMAADGHRCVALGSPSARTVPGVRRVRWGSARGNTGGVFPLAVKAEADMIRGRSAAEAAFRLKQAGFVPDLIVGHPGWGETLFLREVFPKARQVIYAEYYYHASGTDSDFDPEFPYDSLEQRCGVVAKNATLAAAYLQADRLVAPTRFQADRLPDVLRSRAEVIHDGIDTGAVSKRPGRTFTLPSGEVQDGSRPVVTFIARRLEPLRGYHRFMRALPEAMRRAPDARVVIVGADGDGYGLPSPGRRGWKEVFLREVAGEIDLGRLTFTGPIPHAAMLDLLAVSSAHVYLTYPFVLSWSLLEAMAMEGLVIGSDTAPVREVVEHGRNGLLVDFFDTAALADAIVQACEDRAAGLGRRAEARRTVVERFDLARVCLPRWKALLAAV